MGEINFRKVVASDWDAMYKFIKQTWEGHDYIPRVWDKWLSDENSEFILGEVDGVIVGCVRLKALSPGELWLEGLRVRSEYQGRGYAWLFQDEIIERAMRYNPRAIRYSTGDANEASIHIGKTAGFSVLNTYQPFFINDKNLTASSELPLEGSESIENSYNVLSEAVRLDMNIGFLLSQAWVFYEINQQNLTTGIPDCQVFYRNVDGEVVDVISFGLDERYDEININILYSISSNLEALILSGYAQLPGEWKGRGVFFCCSNEKYTTSLRNMGFERRYGDFNIIVMEKSISGDYNNKGENI